MDSLVTHTLIFRRMLFFSVTSLPLYTPRWYLSAKLLSDPLWGGNWKQVRKRHYFTAGGFPKFKLLEGSQSRFTDSNVRFIIV